MEGSITNLALILNNSVEYIMQGRMPKFSNSPILDKIKTQGRKPKLTFFSAVELRFSNYSNIVFINSSQILDG